MENKIVAVMHFLQIKHTEGARWHRHGHGESPRHKVVRMTSNHLVTF